MARGISETDVHTAADALVAGGERPTVERIRAHLGTGSPNTVTRWLDSWWQQLGARLAAQHVKLALPTAPTSVVELATHWWEQALAAARVEAEQGLAEQRAHLDAQRRELAEQHGAWQAQIHQHAAMSEQARQLLAAAEQRLADVQRTCEVQAEQLRDLGAQRDAAHVRGERVGAELSALQANVAERELALTREREAQARHVRAIEDRMHAEVDRARQETKESRAQLSALARERDAREAALQMQRDQATSAQAAAQRELAAVAARATALEAQLGELHKTLAAGNRSAAKPPRRTTARRTPTRG